MPRSPYPRLTLAANKRGTKPANPRLVTNTPTPAGTTVQLHRENSGHRRGGNFLSVLDVQDLHDGPRSTHQSRVLPDPASPRGQQRAKKRLSLRAAASRLGRRKQLSRSTAVSGISVHSTRQLSPARRPKNNRDNHVGLGGHISDRRLPPLSFPLAVNNSARSSWSPTASAAPTTTGNSWALLLCSN